MDVITVHFTSLKLMLIGSFSWYPEKAGQLAMGNGQVEQRKWNGVERNAFRSCKWSAGLPVCSTNKQTNANPHLQKNPTCPMVQAATSSRALRTLIFWLLLTWEKSRAQYLMLCSCDKCSKVSANKIFITRETGLSWGTGQSVNK